MNGRKKLVHTSTNVAGEKKVLSPKKKNIPSMAEVNPNDPHVEKLFEIAKAWVAEHESPNVSNVVAFATNLMQSIQKMVTEPGMGEYKAKVVMTVARKIVAEVNYESEADREAALSLVNTMLPGAMAAIKLGAAALISNHGRQPMCCC